MKINTYQELVEFCETNSLNFIDFVRGYRDAIPEECGEEVADAIEQRIKSEGRVYSSEECTEYFSYKDQDVEFYFQISAWGTSTVQWEDGNHCEVFPKQVMVTQYSTTK